MLSIILTTLTILSCTQQIPQSHKHLSQILAQADSFFSSEPDSALLLQDIALKISETEKEKAHVYVEKAQTYYFIGDIDNTKKSLDKAYEYYKNIRYSTDTIEIQDIININEIQADIYNSVGDINSAIKIYNRISKFAKRHKYAETYIQYELLIHNYEERTGRFTDAIDGYEKLLTYCNQQNITSSKFNILKSLQSVFLTIGDIKESSKYIDMMCEYADDGCKDCILCLAEYANSKAIGDTLEQKKCIEILKKIENHFSTDDDLNILYVLSQHYIDNKQYDEAKYYADKIEVQKYMKSSEIVISANLLYSQIYLASNQIKEAYNAIKDIDSQELKQYNAILYNLYLDILSKIYYKQNNYKKSYETESLRTAFADSLQRMNISNNIAYQHIQFQKDTTILSQNARIQHNQNELEKLKFWQQIWLFISIVVIYIGILAYLRVHMSRIRTNEAEIQQMKEKLQLEVKRQTTILQQQSSELEHKNAIIQEEMAYASQLQNDILPPESILDIDIIDDHFVIYEPCTLISGDFYWFNTINNKLYICCGDATGHGIPGTFIAMVCTTILSELAHELQGDSVLTLMNGLDKRLHEILQNNENIHVNDTVDMTMLCIDTQTGKITGVMARHNAYVVKSDGQYIRYQGDRKSIGEVDVAYSNRNFTEVEFTIEDGDCIYLTTDGFESQFGEAEHRKMKRTEMIDNLVEVSKLPMLMQKVRLKEIFNTWKGNTEQTDDVLIIGLKLKKNKKNIYANK